MTIGIDASRAFQKNRTGIEEYSYQVIKNLRKFLDSEQVFLYVNPKTNSGPDFQLPQNWKMKELRAPIFWTQVRLSIEMMVHPVDLLFVPAHTVPLWHPKNSAVTIHGLEYEFCPYAYSFFGRLYMRWSIRNSCRWAKIVIAVSENTKKDLAGLYKVQQEKMKVIYEGYDIPAEAKDRGENAKSALPISNSCDGKPYLLFVGRLEERKNICGIIKAFECLKKGHQIPHRLVLAGKFGYGRERIEKAIAESEAADDIILAGYVSTEEKWALLRNAEVFVFPTFYEGFGLPILEAQSMGTPVVTSDLSSMPEVAGKGALYANPADAKEIAEMTYKLISNSVLRDDIINKGQQNIKRFSWETCAEDIASLFKTEPEKNGKKT